ncbi:TPA: tail fiber protein [Pseudomonas putida]|uniref:phage tail protein n=1 Tax=Pseudomonas putida TaxID=303 RepID=UPI000AA5643B|nr:tail fiber protein [Pseudomonas putida]MDD2116769.1 phage tail protein [Pseudomonas putida]UPU94091.1 phage tail protein [Pseudomonas putida]HDS1728283.1 tail fiber protein [Pseudomonas putida]
MAREAFNTRWAQGVETQDNDNTFKVPDNTRQNTGWEGGQDKDAPRAGQENWWHNRVDSALQDLERRGVMAYHPQAIYAVGAPCYNPDDGLFYESIASNNAGNNPGTSANYWRLIGSSLYSSFSVGEYKDVSHNGSPDPGWLKSVGSVLLRAAYPKLFAKIGTTYNIGGELSTEFRLPDWRALVPRCLDDGRGIDVGRTLSNVPQPSQNLAHGHSASSASAGQHQHTTVMKREYVNVVTMPQVNAVYGDEIREGTDSLLTSANGSHTHTISISSSGGTEARMINGGQVRWIRYL